MIKLQRSPTSVLSWLLQQIFDNLLAAAMLLLFSFMLLQYLPGNQVDALLTSDIGRAISSEDYANTTQRLGFDRSALHQFGDWLTELLQGNLGYSILHRAPVSEVLSDALPWTLTLVLLSLPISLLLGAFIGLLTGMHPQRKPSQLAFTLMTLLSSLPSFVVALLLLNLFAFTLGWFPTGGGVGLSARLSGKNELLDLIWHAALPLTALCLHGCIRYFYLAYGLAQQIGQRAFIRYARQRGITGWHLLRHWYLPNAMPELLSRLSSSLPGMVGVTVFVEVVFSYPGVGSLLLDAIHNRDYLLLQGALLLTGLMVLVGNTFLDLLTTVLTVRG